MSGCYDSCTSQPQCYDPCGDGFQFNNGFPFDHVGTATGGHKHCPPPSSHVPEPSTYCAFIGIAIGVLLAMLIKKVWK